MPRSFALCFVALALVYAVLFVYNVYTGWCNPGVPRRASHPHGVQGAVDLRRRHRGQHRGGLRRVQEDSREGTRGRQQIIHPVCKDFNRNVRYNNNNVKSLYKLYYCNIFFVRLILEVERQVSMQIFILLYVILHLRSSLNNVSIQSHTNLEYSQQIFMAIKKLYN